MPTSFSRTLRSLEAGGSRRWATELLIVALLGAWVAWFLGGRVEVREFTGKAWLEVLCAPQAVTAQVPGQIVEDGLWVGRQVRRGDPLVKLDSRAEQLAVQER
jgi:multidrug resistance efflux pump